MELEDYRRFYSKEIQFAAHLDSLALIEAFAHVPRENFLGPGPWQIAHPGNQTGRGDPYDDLHND